MKTAPRGQKRKAHDSQGTEPNDDNKILLPGISSWQFQVDQFNSTLQMDNTLETRREPVYVVKPQNIWESMHEKRLKAIECESKSFISRML